MTSRSAPERARAVLADPRWLAVRQRDSSEDGRFVFSVASTGVFCRPGCSARTPRPENVAFHADPAAARLAGFRPCLRCQPEGAPPTQREAERIARICARLRTAEPLPTLQQLAEAEGLSRFHLQRSFRAATGLSPHAWAHAARAERLRELLPGSPSVTDALLAAGYGSASRFHAHSPEALDMPARAARKTGQKGEPLSWATAPCSLGAVLVAASSSGLCAILLGDAPAPLQAELASRFPAATLTEAPAALASRLADVVALIEEPRLARLLPLDLRGTAFQRRVWQALRQIPAGETRSYAALAAELGAPRSARAVARACATNALAVAIPCHRVVRGDGSLSGYRWGVERKRALLEREARER